MVLKEKRFLVLACLLALFNACGSSDGVEKDASKDGSSMPVGHVPPELVGTWSLSHNTGLPVGEVYTFSEKGTYTNTYVNQSSCDIDTGDSGCSSQYCSQITAFEGVANTSGSVLLLTAKKKSWTSANCHKQTLPWQSVELNIEPDGKTTWRIEKTTLFIARDGDEEGLRYVRVQK